MDEAERLLNDLIERAEQACRYALKHQNGEDVGAEVMARVCEEAIRPHLERHGHISAVLAAMRKPGGMSDSWRLVPVKPTAEQMLAADRVTEQRHEFAMGCNKAKINVTNYEAYSAMVAEAPQPPALDRDGIIEECAKVAEAEHACGDYRYEGPAEIAAAIRAMKVQK
jgi:hypothetical protein